MHRSKGANSAAVSGSALRARSRKAPGDLPLQVTLKLPGESATANGIQSNGQATRIGSAASSLGRATPGSARSLNSRASSVMSVPASTISSASSVTSNGSAYVHLEYEGGRHLHPERLPSARPDRTVTMKLTEVTDETLEGLFLNAPMLRRLDLSATQLFAFPGELIPHLECIERLVLDDNRLTVDSFTRNFTELSTLREISAARNKLRYIPSYWLKMRHINRLNLEANALEHLRGIEKLKRLKSLVLDKNSISTLQRDFYTLKRLELLYISRNSLSILHIDVKNLTHLRELDISHNRLQSLPADVFVLPRLEHLNASQNAINRLPSLSLKGKPKRKIQNVDLSGNSLIRFPEHLMRIVENLDVSSNRIKVIPGSLLKRIDWKTTQEVDVSNNPIMAPPREICESGLRAMVQYYHESKIESKAYQGIKMMVLGSRGSGKTSLVQSLVDQQPRLTEDDERTLGVDAYEVSLETSKDIHDPKPLSITMLDFSGESFYNKTNFYFLQLPSLTLITFNLSSYKSEDFNYHIGSWLDMLIMRNNQLIFILVGTHADKLKKPVARQRLNQAKEDAEEYLRKYIESIEDEIRKIESRPQISPALSEQYKHFLHLKCLRVLFHAEPLGVSSSSYEGYDVLEKTIIDMSTEAKTFPSVMRVIPSLWIDIESYFEERGNDEPLIDWEFFGEVIQRRFGLKHVAKNIGQYMHDTGKVLWAESDPNFRNKMMLRPPVLSDLLGILFRHNLQEYLHDPLDRDEYIRRYLKSSSSARLIRHRSQFLEEGIVEPELMRALLGGMTNSDRQMINLLGYVCCDLELGYVVGKKLKDGTVLSPLAVPAKAGANPQSNPPSGRAKEDDAGGRATANEAPGPFDGDEIPRILLPINRVNDEPASAEQEWADLATQAPCDLCAIFKFHRMIPPGMYERFTVRLHQFDRFHLRYVAHWKDGVLASDCENPVYLRVIRGKHEDGQDVLKLEARIDLALATKVEPETDFTPVMRTETMWRSLLPLIKDFEDLLQQYPGTWFRRQMACPFCKENTFLGEWLTPKELQCVPHKVCQLCNQSVPTIYLVQPREKRKVEEIMRLKQQVRAKKQQEEQQKQSAAAAAAAEVERTSTGHFSEDETVFGSPEPGSSQARASIDSLV